MAITINYEPSGFASAHNPMFIELQSNQSGQANFKYVFDVYVNNAFATRQKVYPNPTDGKGYLDISKIVGNYFDVAQNVVDESTKNFTTELGLGEFFVDFKGIYGEDYSGTPFVSGTVSGTTYKAYNWSKWKSLLRSSTPKGLSDFQGRFLSNRPRVSTAYINQPVIITAWPSLGTESYLVNQIHYNGSTSIGSDTTTAFANGNPRTGNVQPTLFLPNSGATSVLTELLYDPVNLAMYDDRLFNIVCHPRYTPVTLMFLNRLGGWDSFTFGLYNELSIDAEKKSFAQNPFVGRSDLIGGGFVRETNKVFAVSYKTKWKLTGDSLTKDEYIWLEELITSPLVYVYLPDTTNARNWHPVTVAETNYVVKNHLIDKQNFIELNIEFAEPEKSQYR